MNKYFQKILDEAKSFDAKIVIPETGDERLDSAKKELTHLGCNILDVEDFANKKSEYIDLLSKREFSKNWSKEMLTEYLNNPIHLGLTMVANGDADGFVSGVNTSKDKIIRSAIRTIGVQQNSKFVFSSTFLLHRDNDISYTYADCSVLPEPNSDQLALIAWETAIFYKQVFGETPRLAFISFSTLGSMEHYRVEKVRKAMDIFRKKHGDMSFIGEVQFDCAINKSSASYKLRDNEIAGNANVLIFPNMDAGNVAVKSAEIFGEFTSVGPLLHGLNKPVGIVSRACSVENIVSTVIFTTKRIRDYADLQL